MAGTFCRRCLGSNHKNFTDEDIKAVFAYLRSIPPVKNQVPLPVVPGATPSKTTP